eukprot:PITA_18660
MSMENRHIYCSQVHLPVKVIESVLVPPSQHSPNTVLDLSNLDDHFLVRRTFDVFLVYSNGSKNIYSATNPARVIQDALSQLLSYYYPLAGRVRRTQDGRKLEVDCTGEGALFFEADTESTLPILGEFEELKSSFEQLLFQFPLTVEIEEVPPLILQVTNFNCGGFVVGVSINHSLCDGRGAVQFLMGLAEIAREETKLSIEAVWQREDLKPQPPYLVRFQHHELLESGYFVNPNTPLSTVKSEDLVFASFYLNSDALERIKRPIVEELKEHCTTFDVLAAFAWRARTRVLGIPFHHVVRFIFPVDVRRSFDPPLAEGYYGNGQYVACTHSSAAEEVVNGSLSHAVKLIKKAKLAVNEEYVRSGIAFLEMKRSCPEMTDVHMCLEDTIFTDWRWLGFNQVDFGWGEPLIDCPGNWLKISNCPISFLPSKKTKSGVTMVFCVPRPALKILESELHGLM